MAAVGQVPDLRIRMVWETGRTTLATGERIDQNTWAARTQAGVTLFPSSRLRVRTRVAGILSSQQEGSRFLFQSHAPGPGGLRPGDWTVDELNLELLPADGWRIRAGRLQTGFSLPAVISRSLDRIDSPSGSVTWTDGLHVEAPLPGAMKGHLVLQHQSPQGTTNTIRPPLDFGTSDPGWSLFSSVSLGAPRGRILASAVDWTYLPSVTPVPGPPAASPEPDPAVTALVTGDPKSYHALVSRVAVLVADDLVAGGRLVAGFEGGAAWGTPARSLVGVGRTGTGESQGLAFLASLSLQNMGRRHSLGGSFASVGDGWLISPSFLPNYREVEARYRLQLHPRSVVEVRIRGRKQVIPMTGRTGRRGETNGFVRMTLSW